VFVGKIINITTGFDGQGPVYADAIGMDVNNMLGIYIPRFITGKK
jgi:hypothetical protein